MANLSTVVGTIQDTDGQVWSEATWLAELIVPGGPQKAVFKDGSGVVTANVTGMLNAGGSFQNPELADVNAILPTGCSWRFTLAPLASAPAVSPLPLFVTGAFFGAGAPLSVGLQGLRIQSKSLVYAYAATEVINPVNGDGYVNTISGETFFWNGSAWILISGGGSGDVTAGNPQHLAFYDPTAPGSTTTLVQIGGIFADNAGNLTANVSLTTPKTILNFGAASTTGPIADAPSQIQTNMAFLIEGPGYDLGSAFAGSAGGWTVFQAQVIQPEIATRGIAQTIGLNSQKHAVGDHAGIYSYVRFVGGFTALADEGVSGATIQAVQLSSYFRGTIGATSGTGDTNPTLTFAQGSNYTIDGGILLNISKGTVTSRFNGLSVAAFTFLQSIPTTGGLPLSTAIGIVQAGSLPIAWNNTTADVATPVTITVQLQEISGTFPAFAVNDHVAVGGQNYPEHSKITAVTAPTGGNLQTITLALRNPNAAAVIFANGIQNQYISADGNLSFFRDGSNLGIRSCYMCLGSLDGTNLIYCIPTQGQTAGFFIPNTGKDNFTTDGSANAAFHLYPGAEIVANATFGSVPTLEQNNVAWTVGDSIENPYPATTSVTGIFINVDAESVQTTVGLAISVGGNFTGGGSYGISVNNQNTNYNAQVTPPEAAINCDGLWQSGIIFGISTPNFLLEVNTFGAGQTLCHVVGLPDINSPLIWDIVNRTWIIQAGHFEITLGLTGPNQITSDEGYATNGHPGISATIVTAAITPTGTQGSMTFVGGILTAQTPAT